MCFYVKWHLGVSLATAHFYFFIRQTLHFLNKSIYLLLDLKPPHVIKDFFKLFFPDNCPGCGQSFLRGEKHVCLQCLYGLHKTQYHNDPENPIAKNFWGKTDFVAVTAVYFFQKGQVLQRLLHQLKYNGCKEIGIMLGRQMAIELFQASAFSHADIIIPVPLHPGKLLQRGFNQSEMIAIGMAENWQKEVHTETLKRKKYTQSQTHKARYERFENTESVFELDDVKPYENKHVLLVDDVISTGSTIISCAEAFSGINGCKISMASVAAPHR